MFPDINIHWSVVNEHNDCLVQNQFLLFSFGDYYFFLFLLSFGDVKYFWKWHSLILVCAFLFFAKQLGRAPDNLLFVESMDPGA